jgi:hypothetical protein
MRGATEQYIVFAAVMIEQATVSPQMPLEILAVQGSTSRRCEPMFTAIRGAHPRKSAQGIASHDERVFDRLCLSDQFRIER